MTDALAIAAGLVILAVGADRFVLGAARLAVTFRLSPVVVGAVVVGFGTGTPELVVSSIAATRDATEIGVGNIVGSNLANVTLVLGVAGLVAARLRVASEVVRREAPLSVASVVLFAVLVQDGLTRVEGVVLLAGLVVATAFMLWTARERPAAADELGAELEEYVEERGESDLDAVVEASTARDVARTVLGLAGTIAGAQLLVRGAEGVADSLDLSQGFVGVTLVAVGTSLPEVVTAVLAARRNETALLIGNVLGSNLFNSLAVGGAVAVISPQAIADAGLVVVGVSVMVTVGLLSWGFLALGGAVRRWEAILLLVVYLAALPFMAG